MKYAFLTVTAQIGLLAGLMAAPMAFAQTSTTTVDDIVCKMSNTCDAAPAPSDADKQKVGDEKMFSLQKTQAAPAASGQKVGDEKMFSMQAAAPAATPAASGGQPSYYKPNAPAKTYKPAKHTTYASAQPAPAAASAEAMTMQVHFQLGSAELTDDTKGELTKYVQAMQRPELASMKFAIDGHTDSSGAYATNMDLSQRRAQSVVDYLVANGVSADRLTAHGYGPDRPLSGVKKSSALNRRVELVRVD